MVRLLQRIFSNRCPYCQVSLRIENNPLSYSKMCPQGHYKVETLPLFEVNIIYDRAN
jgi:hypothetical protein